MNVHEPQALHETLLRTLEPRCRYRDGQDPAVWRQEARQTLIRLLGLDHIPPCEPEPHILERREEAEWEEIRLSLTTEPGYEALMHLLLPKGVSRPPVVICLQGHSTGMHISLGRPRSPKDEEDVAGDRDYALQAVRNGFAALTVEQRGFGECGGGPDGPLCRLPASTALLLGRTLIGERVRDIQCAVDLLRSGAFPVDGDRIAVTGNSGGGTASIYAAAVDERITACMPSCAFTSFYASIGVRAHCFCNYIPGIARDFDMGDLCALIAPRPLVIIAGTKDTSFPLREAREQFAFTEQVYARLSALDRCRLIAGPEGHRYYADLAWPAFHAVTGW
jgi:hypothetical protein